MEELDNLPAQKHAKLDQKSQSKSKPKSYSTFKENRKKQV